MPHRFRKTYRQPIDNPSFPTKGDATQLLTSEQIALELQTTLSSVCKLIHSGQIAAFRVAKKFLVKRGDLETFLESRRYVPASDTPIEA
jgi:excisionase family DNA binding protein